MTVYIADVLLDNREASEAFVSFDLAKDWLSKKLDLDNADVEWWETDYEGHVAHIVDEYWGQITVFEIKETL